jgi:ribose 5-phosphate isomerase B
MLIIVSDHRGYDLKEDLKKWFFKKQIDFVDIGAKNYDHEDSYVDYSKKAMDMFSQNKKSKAILICGSGVGVCIVANRYKDVRAFVASSKKMVKHAVAHDDANVLCLSADYTSLFKAKCYIKTFLATTFLSGKYLKRIEKIDS